MKYLLYFHHGFVKKLPLDKKTLVVGRGPDCDGCIDEEFISRRHVAITVFRDRIEVEDLGSKNGVFIDGAKVCQGSVRVNHFFRVGYLELILKEGNAEEFELSEETRPLCKKISRLFSACEETKSCWSLFDQALVATLRLGLKGHAFQDILRGAGPALVSSLKQGYLFLVVKEGQRVRMVADFEISDGSRPKDWEALLDSFDVFASDEAAGVIDSDRRPAGFSLRLDGRQASLVYVFRGSRPLHPRQNSFLKELAKELALIHAVIGQNVMRDKTADSEIVTRSPTRAASSPEAPRSRKGFAAACRSGSAVAQ